MLDERTAERGRSKDSQFEEERKHTVQVEGEEVRALQTIDEDLTGGVGIMRIGQEKLSDGQMPSETRGAKGQNLF